MEGKLYKFDVRQEETLSKDNNSKIIIGFSDLWVFLSVESYWIDKIDKGMKFAIFNTETKGRIKYRNVTL
ncbi:MAG: hypothetical protein D6734_10100 [Candidatus Schekmanbacteria bacterium]|nr:MAG: hypothetical protein D6734_10100 [Candidatus Schekmanbacteria bacterium]